MTGSHVSRLNAIEKRLARDPPEPLWRYVAVERSSSSPTGFIDLFTREAVDPAGFDHCTVVEWVEPERVEEYR